jgi:outer membrane lipoprotein-sorting protein
VVLKTIEWKNSQNINWRRWVNILFLLSCLGYLSYWAFQPAPTKVTAAFKTIEGINFHFSFFIFGNQIPAMAIRRVALC